MRPRSGGNSDSAETFVSQRGLTESIFLRMAQFAYKARRRSGEMVQGILEVPDRSAALAQIERLGMFPVSIDASKAGGDMPNRITLTCQFFRQPVGCHLHPAPHQPAPDAGGDP